MVQSPFLWGAREQEMEVSETHTGVAQLLAEIVKQIFALGLHAAVKIEDPF